MATELKKLGARAEAGADRVRAHPPAELRAASVDTYDDHRMAMCLSLATLAGVASHDQRSGCVRKTFPAISTLWCRIVQPLAAS